MAATLNEDLTGKLATWMDRVVDGKTYTGYETDGRRKYVRVCVRLAQQQLSAYAFVDPVTGEIFRAKSSTQRGYRMGVL